MAVATTIGTVALWTGIQIGSVLAMLLGRHCLQSVCWTGGQVLCGCTNPDTWSLSAFGNADVVAMMDPVDKQR